MTDEIVNISVFKVTITNLYILCYAWLLRPGALGPGRGTCCMDLFSHEKKSTKNTTNKTMYKRQSKEKTIE